MIEVITSSSLNSITCSRFNGYDLSLTAPLFENMTKLHNKLILHQYLIKFLDSYIKSLIQIFQVKHLHDELQY